MKTLLLLTVATLSIASPALAVSACAWELRLMESMNNEITVVRAKVKAKEKTTNLKYEICELLYEEVELGKELMEASRKFNICAGNKGIGTQWGSHQDALNFSNRFENEVNQKCQ